ncbi:MAG: RNA polymerase sigma factor, partial [Myxococcota bacterium]
MRMTGPTGDRRIQRARLGNRRARESLLREHEQRIWSVARRMLAGRAEDARDVTQDAMVRILRELENFDPHGTASFATWATVLTTRVCLDFLRKQHRRATSPVALHAPQRSNPGESRSELRSVERRIALLPPDQRAVLVLRAYHDFDLAEIADALDLPVGTVKSRLARA